MKVVHHMADSERYPGVMFSSLTIWWQPYRWRWGFWWTEARKAWRWRFAIGPIVFTDCVWKAERAPNNDS